MAVLASVVAALGSFLAGMGSQACFFIFLDEPNCPKSLIK